MRQVLFLPSTIYNPEKSHIIRETIQLLKNSKSFLHKSNNYSWCSFMRWISVSLFPVSLRPFFFKYILHSSTFNFSNSPAAKFKPKTMRKTLNIFNLRNSNSVFEIFKFIYLHKHLWETVWKSLWKQISMSSL